MNLLFIFLFFLPKMWLSWLLKMVKSTIGTQPPTIVSSVHLTIDCSRLFKTPHSETWTPKALVSEETCTVAFYTKQQKI